ADDALVLHPLVLAAQALVILDRTENPRAEQTVALGLEGAIVDGLRLFDLAVRPRLNLLRARDRNPDLVEDLSRHLRSKKIHNLLVHYRLRSEFREVGRRPADQACTAISISSVLRRYPLWSVTRPPQQPRRRHRAAAWNCAGRR